jgi:H+-transporting ATPase
MVMINSSATDELRGLTSSEAAARLAQYGPNQAAEERPHPLLTLLGKFWAPVPWMLELTIVVELLLHRYSEAGIIGVLLIFNAGIGLFQEQRARSALSLLRQRLEIQARVLRDGRWQLLPARGLVPGDAIHLRVGDVSPADVRIASGQVLLDQSALTGESLPVDAGPGQPAYAATIVRRGEATGRVTATGTRTTFGRTTELVRLAQTRSHLEAIIFSIVKYLAALDAVLVAGVLVYALAAGLPAADVLPFALILLVASVPVALPATFTIATALGAMELAREGVLVTRLAAIEEAAGMDVLCSDKTGTITQNRLTVSAVRPRAPHTDDELLRLAALASEESTQDPIDLAIIAAARARGALPPATLKRRFVPFDPSTKRSEALLSDEHAGTRVVKGAPAAVQALCEAGSGATAGDVEAMAADGSRVLAVAAGAAGMLRPVGLIALRDPPREDAAALVGHLRGLGVRVVMVTGDGPATAAAVARQVGIGDRVCPPEVLRGEDPASALSHDVFAGVLPEEKFRLVTAFQRAGHTTGMTGDGVNDAPALKQAEVGIAVASATDVAKAAASMVLTNPGLNDVVAAIQTSRRIYRRMLTYTLNKIVKTCEISLFLSLGLIVTGTFITTPTLIVLLLFTNDFVTMSIATDRVEAASTPRRWHIRPLALTGLGLAVLVLALSFTIFFVGRDVLHLPLPQLQTLVFVMLVGSGQGTVYLVRESRHFWRSVPSRPLLVSSLVDIVVVGLLATHGILMAPISPALLAATLALILLYLAAIDFIKVKLVGRWL